MRRVVTLFPRRCYVQAFAILTELVKGSAEALVHRTKEVFEGLALFLGRVYRSSAKIKCEAIPTQVFT
jgi:hypothetical protein